MAAGGGALARPPRTVSLPVLALTFNAFTWGVSWWPFRQLEGQGLHALWATALIYSVAVLAIAAFDTSVQVIGTLKLGQILAGTVMLGAGAAQARSSRPPSPLNQTTRAPSGAGLPLTFTKPDCRV